MQINLFVVLVNRLDAMNYEYLATYKNLLFNDSFKTYTIVDTLREPELHEVLGDSNLYYVNLWHHELKSHSTKREVYLLELKSTDELVEYLLRRHDKGLATYFHSNENIHVLREYYSYFTYPMIELEPREASQAILGFYDANILYKFIATLHNKDKVEEFFAGTALWMSPSLSREDEVYIAYQDKTQTLQTKHITLDYNTNPLPRLEEIHLSTQKNLATLAHEVEIDYEQVQILDGFEKQKYLDDVFVRAKEDEYVFKNDEKTNREKANELFDEAKGLGVKSEDAVYKYIILALLVDKALKEFAFYGELGRVSDEEEKEEIINEALWKTIQGRELDER